MEKMKSILGIDLLEKIDISENESINLDELEEDELLTESNYSGDLFGDDENLLFSENLNSEEYLENTEKKRK